HGRPVVLVFTNLCLEAFPRAAGVPERPAIPLDVELQNAVTEHFNPVLGPAVVDDVANVEIPPDPRTLKLVDVPRGLQRAKKEVVPDVFDRNLYSFLLGQRKNLADLHLRPFIGIVVRDLLVHHRGYKKYGRSPVSLGVVERRFESSDAFRTDSRVR